MATLDRLSPDKRAIIELVLRRGQSYADLAAMLGMPESRVRQHAREALAALAPRTAARVEPDWRDQVADYLLRQQAGPQARATLAHLRRSEAARAWALSMLDSLGELYPDGREPSIPESGAPRPRAERRRGRRGERDAGRVPARPPAPRRDREAARRPAPAAAPPERGPTVSPGASALVVRRRIAAALAAVVAVVAVVLLVTQLFGGDEEVAEEDPATEPAAQGEPQILAQLELAPVDGEEGSGVAVVAQQEGQNLLIVQAKLPPTERNEAYEVWLYNDEEDAVSLGAQVTDEEGNFQGAGPLPDDFERYEFIDVSLEPRDGDASHSGNSMLRAQLQGGEATGGAGGAAPEGTETPDPESVPTLPDEGG